MHLKIKGVSLERVNVIQSRVILRHNLTTKLTKTNFPDQSKCRSQPNEAYAIVQVLLGMPTAHSFLVCHWHTLYFVTETGLNEDTFK